MIVDPSRYDPTEAAKEAAKLVAEFCRVNELRQPLVRNDDKYTANRGYYSINRLRGEGGPADWQGELYFNPRRCLLPVKVPGWCWSFTGYKSDNTVPGVIAHECGHHVWFCLIWHLNKQRQHLNRQILFDCWKSIRNVESGITSYGDTQTEEDWAESLKLFILNPDLLRVGRPKRYEYLVSCELKPVIVEDWRTILKFAHERLIEAAESWIAKGGAL